MIEANYIWRCEKCGEPDRSTYKKYLVESNRLHKCNPVLYDLIRNIKTDFKYKGVIINNNGAKADVMKYLGITEKLAAAILSEMEERELAKTAIPFRV